MDIKKMNLNIEFISNLGMEYDLISDNLTNALNRKYMLDYVEWLVLTNKPFVLIDFDIDKFKAFNNENGHKVGDEVLKIVSNIIAEKAPKGSAISRFGGDEFVVIVPGVKNYDEKWSMLREFHQALRTKYIVDGKEYDLTVTSGSAAFPENGKVSAEILINVDKAVYRGKEKGGNCYIIFNEARHKDLKINSITTMPEKMKKLKNTFKGGKGIKFEVYEALITIRDLILIEGAGYFSKNNLPMIYNGNLSMHMTCMDIDLLNSFYNDGIIKINSIDELPENGYLYNYLLQYNIRSALIVPVGANNKDFGYIMIYSPHNKVWQEHEITLMIYLADLIAYNLLLF